MQKKTVISTLRKDSEKLFSSFLHKLGLDVISFPMIKTECLAPKENDIGLYHSLERFNYLIFTSKNGVNCFFNNLIRLTKTASVPGNLNIISIGRATAHELLKYGCQAYFISEKNSAKEFLDELTNSIISAGDKALLALGNLASGILTDGINKVAYAKRTNVYQTVMPDDIDLHVVRQVKRNNADMIIFASPSAFNNFVRITDIPAGDQNIKIAAIGNTTADYIKGRGYIVHLVASRPEYKIFAEEIYKYLKQ